MSKFTDEEAEALLKELSVHYGVRVAPVAHYCSAFEDWRKAIQGRASRLFDELYPGIQGDSRSPETIAAHARYKAEKVERDLKVLRTRGEEPTQRDYDLNTLEGYRQEVLLMDGFAIDIHKSDLLYRLIYCGEKLRTEQCPEHKGEWSGLEHPDHRCPHGCGLTGWLPLEKAPPQT
jgi:hypothetical protein